MEMSLIGLQPQASFSLCSQGRNREASVSLTTDMGCLGRRTLGLRTAKASTANSNHFLEVLNTLKPFTCALFSQFEGHILPTRYGQEPKKIAIEAQIFGVYNIDVES